MWALPRPALALVAHVRIAGLGIGSTAAVLQRSGGAQPWLMSLSPFLDDGAIRVWKNFADLEKNPEMVTAWQGLSDMLPTTRGGSGSQTRC